jgi:hypothetical protein
MIDIPILAIPNQSFSIQLDSNFIPGQTNTQNLVNFNIRIHSCDSNPTSIGTAIMSVSIEVNSGAIPIILVDNVRASSSGTLIGYSYLEIYGDFLFTTDNDEYPNYNQFSITQFLTYVSAAEIAAIRAVHG